MLLTLSLRSLGRMSGSHPYEVKLKAISAEGFDCGL